MPWKKKHQAERISNVSRERSRSRTSFKSRKKKENNHVKGCRFKIKRSKTEIENDPAATGRKVRDQSKLKRCQASNKDSNNLPEVQIGEPGTDGKGVDLSIFALPGSRGTDFLNF